MASAADVKSEQAYFDAAAEARERSRQHLSGAPNAAAGSRAAVRGVRKAVDKTLASLGGPDDQVAFGMFAEEDGERLYLGKHAISDEQRNKLVINWQAPAASPYFEATYDEPCGIALRRKFSTDGNTILDFDQVVFEELAEAVASITEADEVGIDDAVLRDLDQDRDGEMRDIVQTIHAAQYGLIREDPDQLLVIQGGPGTGKTAVALHRVSWILWNHGTRIKPEDVLVVGPNPTFTKYIRKVLPGLGDEDVRHQDLRSLGPIVSSSRIEAPDVQRLKGEERMAELLATGLRQRVRFPQGEHHLEIGSGPRPPRLLRTDVESTMARYLSGNATYQAGRAGLRSWVAQQASSATAAQVDAAVERVWPLLSPQQFLRELLGSRERLVGAAGELFTAGDIGRLQRTAASKQSEETWSDADVALLDEAAYLISGRDHAYAHVVVDEAQDLSPMQLRSLRRRSRNGSMTLVGDIAQATGPSARGSWEEVIAGLQQDLPASVRELTLGYRVPKQVYALAAELLPQAAPGVTPPRVVREGPKDPELVHCDEGDQVARAVDAARDYAGRGLFVGVVSPDSMRQELCTSLDAADVSWSDAGRGDLSRSINVMSADQAKGLEFDAVVVVEPVAIASESVSGLRLLYVALTRTTRYLTIAHAGPVLPTRAGADATAPADLEVPTAIFGQDGESAPVAESAHSHGRLPGGGAKTVRRPGERQGELFGVVPSPIDEDAGHRTTRSDLSTPAKAHQGEVSKVAMGVAASLAAEIRESVLPGKYAEVLEALRRELAEEPPEEE